MRFYVIAYLAIGAVVSLAHPWIRSRLAELWQVEAGTDVILKPVFGCLGFLVACLVWPIACFTAVKAKKHAAEQEERFQSLARLYGAMNAPAKYSGGDGSSFEQAVIIVGATLASGPRAAYTYIERRYPGCQHNGQSLHKQDGKTYDVLEFTTDDGDPKKMYFDISAHFQPANDAS